jgi:hypothetical protein
VSNEFGGNCGTSHPVLKRLREPEDAEEENDSGVGLEEIDGNADFDCEIDSGTATKEDWGLNSGSASKDDACLGGKNGWCSFVVVLCTRAGVVL